MNPMIAKANITDLVGNLIAGTGVRSACARLSKCGQPAVNAVLDALDGKHGLALKNRHPRDLLDDLVGALHAIATVNPDPLISALDDRPQHAVSLIWALGGSRHRAAVEKLIEYSKYKDLWVRWAAVEGLVRCRKKSLLQPLLAALRDRSDMVRFSALRGLSKVADRTAIEPLKHYLARKRLSPGGQRVASELLSRLEKAEQ